MSRDDWAQAALSALAEDGLAAVSIDPIARKLGATKGSFYWHFANRDDLIAAALDLWERRDTTEIIAALDQLDNPDARLTALARSAFRRAARGADAHASVLAAAGDPRVAPVLHRVAHARLATLEGLYRDAGLDPIGAQRRARLAYAMYAGTIDLRRAMPDSQLSDAETNADIELMVDLTRPTAREEAAAEPQPQPTADDVEHPAAKTAT